jgi:NTP pyrophosphatase (non-canonical NTP hydrolase)
VRAADEIERIGFMRDLIDAVVKWAMDRRIIPNSNPQSQLLKCMSELGELADATLKKDEQEIMDGVGDVIVTLILYSALQGIDIESCLSFAYHTIKDRKGTLTPEGVFVKDA